MARKTVLVSDLTGKPIEEADAVEVRIVTAETIVRLDVHRDEVTSFLAKGREEKKRGRKPRTAKK